MFWGSASWWRVPCIKELRYSFIPFYILEFSPSLQKKLGWDRCRMLSVFSYGGVWRGARCPSACQSTCTSSCSLPLWLHEFPGYSLQVRWQEERRQCYAEDNAGKITELEVVLSSYPHLQPETIVLHLPYSKDSHFFSKCLLQKLLRYKASSELFFSLSGVWLGKEKHE